ncbi:MAG: hypothetical protein HDQ93_02080 [Desulfovibrio sp.]|nr:hypothetical protein [Desulfovibrio sp.]
MRIYFSATRLKIPGALWLCHAKGPRNYPQASLPAKGQARKDYSPCRMICLPQMDKQFA